MGSTDSNTSNILRWIFLGTVLLFLLLTAMVTAARNIFGPYLSPVIWFLAGMAFCGSCWYLIYKNELPKLQVAFTLHWKDYTPIGILVLGIAATAWKFSTILPQYPIDPMISDVIPALQQYVGRFLSGADVYAPMKLATWTIFPNYMPLRWMVFIPAEWMGMDYRWWAQIVFYASLVPWYIWLVRTNRPRWLKNFLALVPVTAFSILLWGDPPFWGMVVEQMFVAFYLFLGYALIKRSPVLIGIGILFCLLSRFSISFWLPVFFLAYLIHQGWKKTFVVGAVIAVGILVFFVFPFLTKDSQIFSKSMGYYDTAILDQWKVQYWQQPEDVPYYMNNGLSFSYYFYSLVDGDERTKLDAAKFWHLAGSLAGAILLFGLYFTSPIWKQRWPSFWLVGLAFYLIVFYSFFYMPFPYLYMMPMMVASVCCFVLPHRT